MNTTMARASSNPSTPAWAGSRSGPRQVVILGPVREVDTTTHLPLHYDQLISERRVFCLKSALRPERRGEQGQDEAGQRDHSAPTLGDALT
jgi:hypothetical protein